MKRLSGALILLILVVCVYSKGARGGGSRGGGSRSSSSRSSTSRSSSSRSYSRSGYRKTTILTVMTVMTYSRIGYGRANYYRYDKDEPEYCVYCNASSTNTTCLENKNVCPQSSDCYQMTYNNPNNSDGSLIEKGCLYNPYGTAGCSSKETACLFNNMTNCSCTYCTEPYCNSRGTAVQPVLLVGLLGLVTAVVMHVQRVW